MADTNNQVPAPAPKNHNNPPSDVEILAERLTVKNVYVMRAAEEHIEIANQMPDHFNEEVEAKYTSDLIKLMENCKKELERRREAEKDPYLRQGQYVDYFFSEYKNKLDAAITKARAALGDWLKRKADAEQKERDDQARLAKELQVDAGTAVKMAQAIAAAPVMATTHTKGTASAAALKGKWVGTIKDTQQLDLTKLRPFFLASELQSAVDRFVKQGGRALDGAEIKEIFEAKVK